MTVHKKCEGCRARKIKCDEKQPCCTPCVKKALDCVYKHSQRTPIFVHERLPSVISEGRTGNSKRKAATYDTCNESAVLCVQDHDAMITAGLSLRQRREIGDGAAQVFTFTIQPARPSRRKQKRAIREAELPESGNQSYLQPLQRPFRSIGNGLSMRWHINFYESPCGESKDANIYDIWTKAIPSLIGHANYLDLAIMYFIDGMNLLLDRNESNDRRVYITGQRALKSLRQTVETAAENTNPANVLIAITLHRYTESFKVLNTNSYVPHMQAIDSIIRQMPSSMMQDETMACLRSNLFEDEVLEALLRGHDSCFDDYGTFRPLAATNDRVNDALLALQDLYIRIPRLARLIREAQERDNAHQNVWAAREAYKLSQDLLASYYNGFIEQVLVEEATVNTSTYHLMPPIEGMQAFDFRSGAAFVLAAKYYTYRMLLCGLLLNICSFGQPDATFRTDVIQAKDISAATAVAMCVEFALGRPDSHPLVAMRLFLPVQMAFGAWHRLQKAERSRDLFATPEYQKAVGMKQWCLGIARKVDHIWGNIPTDERQLEGVCETFAGGPLPGSAAAWAGSW